MISHTTTAKKYAGPPKMVPADLRPELYHALTQHEPHQPLALAAYLNGTPSLTDLEELTDGEAAAMLDRLIGNPTYTLAGWIQHLQGRAAGLEVAGTEWLR